MTLRGVLTSTIFAVVLGVISLFNVRVSLALLGVLYFFKAALQLKSKESYEKLEKIMNVDRYNAYSLKDKEFKKYIKSDPISDIIVGALFIYMTFKMSIRIDSLKYAMMIFSFIMVNYFIEVYSMRKSNSWEDYKKKSILSAMVMIFIVFLVML